MSRGKCTRRNYFYPPHLQVVQLCRTSPAAILHQDHFTRRLNLGLDTIDVFNGQPGTPIQAVLCEYLAQTGDHTSEDKTGNDWEEG